MYSGDLYGYMEKALLIDNQWFNAPKKQQIQYYGREYEKIKNNELIEKDMIYYYVSYYDYFIESEVYGISDINYYPEFDNIYLLSAYPRLDKISILEHCSSFPQT